MALIAGSGVMKTIVVLTTAILGVPLFIWGLGSVGLIVFVFFIANPNSLIAWPVALALAFHIYRSFRRRSLPSLPFLLLIPPAALFFKANQAPVFWFLQAAGLSIWAAAKGYKAALKWSVVAGTIWVAAVLLTAAMGPWPVSAGVHPSLDNLWHYARAAFPAQPPGWQLFVMLLSRVLIVAGISAGVVLLRRESRVVQESVVDMLRWQVAIPVGVLILAIGYVAAGWWLVTPSGLAEGEPMHVNIELVMWLCTVIVAGALFSVYDHDDWQDVGESKTVLAGSVSVLVLGFCASMVWSVNGQPMDRGGIPLDRHYDIAVEAKIRDAIRARIPDGDCFRYGRRYAIYVGGQFDPDSVIAATGCPVINGRRWRGYLGDNDPDSLKRQYAIAVDSGRPFRVIEIGGVPGQ